MADIVKLADGAPAPSEIVLDVSMVSVDESVEASEDQDSSSLLPSFASYMGRGRHNLRQSSLLWCVDHDYFTMIISLP